jgi:hypothetical protein
MTNILIRGEYALCSSTRHSEMIKHVGFWLENGGAVWCSRLKLNLMQSILPLMTPVIVGLSEMDGSFGLQPSLGGPGMASRSHCSGPSCPHPHQQFAASIHGHGHGGDRFGRRKGRPPVAARAHAGTAKILFLVAPPRLPFVARPTGQRTRGRRYAIRFLASSIKNK